MFITTKQRTKNETPPIIGGQRTRNGGSMSFTLPLVVNTMEKAPHWSFGAQKKRNRDSVWNSCCPVWNKKKWGEAWSHTLPPIEMERNGGSDWCASVWNEKKWRWCVGVMLPPPSTPSDLLKMEWRVGILLLYCQSGRRKIPPQGRGGYLGSNEAVCGFYAASLAAGMKNRGGGMYSLPHPHHIPWTLVLPPSLSSSLPSLFSSLLPAPYSLISVPTSLDKGRGSCGDMAGLVGVGLGQLQVINGGDIRHGSCRLLTVVMVVWGSLASLTVVTWQFGASMAVMWQLQVVDSGDVVHVVASSWWKQWCGSCPRQEHPHFAHAGICEGQQWQWQQQQQVVVAWWW